MAKESDSCHLMVESGLNGDDGMEDVSIGGDRDERQTSGVNRSESSNGLKSSEGGDGVFRSGSGSSKDSKGSLIARMARSRSRRYSELEDGNLQRSGSKEGSVGGSQDRRVVSNSDRLESLFPKRVITPAPAKKEVIIMDESEPDGVFRVEEGDDANPINNTARADRFNLNAVFPRGLFSPKKQQTDTPSTAETSASGGSARFNFASPKNGQRVLDFERLPFWIGGSRDTVKLDTSFLPKVRPNADPQQSIYSVAEPYVSPRNQKARLQLKGFNSSPPLRDDADGMQVNLSPRSVVLDSSFLPELPFTSEAKQRRKRSWFVLLGLLLLALLIIATVALTTKGSKSVSNTYNSDDQDVSSLDDGSRDGELDVFARLEEILEVDPREPSVERTLHWLEDHPDVLEMEIDLLKERFAVAHIYFSTSGTNNKWTDRLSFLSGSSVCSWGSAGRGITCEQGRVTGIVLSNNMLSGYIPTTIAFLSRLTQVELHQNQVGEHIPSEFGLLSKLEMLNIGQNILTGSIPNELCRLTGLRVLNLNHNSLSGDVPVELWQQTSLVDVALYANPFLGGQIDENVGLLSDMRQLFLYDTQIDGSLPTEIGGLTSVKTLNFKNSEIGGTLPSQLGMLHELEFFSVEGTHVSGPIPNELNLLANLKFLKLQDTNLTGDLNAIFCDSGTFPDEMEAQCGGSSPKVQCSCCSTCV